MPDAGPELAREVAKDAQWNPAAKATLEATGPQSLANLLNRFGVSSEHAPEVLFLTAVTTIAAGHMMLSSKLDRMAAKAEPEKPPVEKKPPEIQHAPA